MRIKPKEFDVPTATETPIDAAVLLAALIAGDHPPASGSFAPDVAARLAAEEPSTFLKGRFTLRF